MTYVYYNLTNLTNTGNSTTILTFISEVNNVTNGVPTLLMLIAIAIVLFLTLHGRGIHPSRSLAATSFVTMILAMIIYPMGLIAGKTLILFSILVPISVFLLWVWGGTEV